LREMSSCGVYQDFGREQPQATGWIPHEALTLDW
jgi:hypothetical protein